MKAIIHIGTPRTGTTSIQNFMVKNREDLHKQGIFYPTSAYWGTGNHIEFAAAAFVPNSPVDLRWFTPMLKKGFTTTDQNKVWEKCRREIETTCNKDDVVIFSCEAFAGFDERGIERVRELIFPLFDDVSIILYLRRQPEWFASLYSNYVRSGGRYEVFFDHHGYNANLEQIVTYWSIFGKDKIKIRIFDRLEFHNNDLLSDFAKTADFDITRLGRVEPLNETMDSAETEFLRLLNSHIHHIHHKIELNNRPYDFERWKLANSLLEYSLKHAEKNKKSYYLNRTEARQILEQYREGNDYVAREYLGREKLFDEDVSMYPEEVASPHGLTPERCAEITAHLWKERSSVIYQLRQENQNLKTTLSSSRRIGHFISYFIPKEKNRKRFRAKYGYGNEN